MLKALESVHRPNHHAYNFAVPIDGHHWIGGIEWLQEFAAGILDELFESGFINLRKL